MKLSDEARTFLDLCLSLATADDLGVTGDGAGVPG